jgi:hypothetical protein
MISSRSILDIGEILEYHCFILKTNTIVGSDGAGAAGAASATVTSGTVLDILNRKI